MLKWGRWKRLLIDCSAPRDVILLDYRDKDKPFSSHLPIIVQKQDISPCHSLAKADILSLKQGKSPR